MTTTTADVVPAWYRFLTSSRLSTNAQRVGAVLSHRARWFDVNETVRAGDVYWSVPRIARELGISASSAERALNELHELGLVVATDRTWQGARVRNVRPPTTPLTGRRHDMGGARRRCVENCDPPSNLTVHEPAPTPSNLTCDPPSNLTCDPPSNLTAKPYPELNPAELNPIPVPTASTDPREGGGIELRSKPADAARAAPGDEIELEVEVVHGHEPEQPPLVWERAAGGPPPWFEDLARDVKDAWPNGVGAEAVAERLRELGAQRPDRPRAKCWAEYWYARGGWAALCRWARGPALQWWTPKRSPTTTPASPPRPTSPRPPPQAFDYELPPDWRTSTMGGAACDAE